MKASPQDDLEQGTNFRNVASNPLQYSPSLLPVGSCRLQRVSLNMLLNVLIMH